MATSPRVPPLAPQGHLSLAEPELRAWGEAFGRAVEAPLVVALSGDLGTGKTTLVQAICRGYGVGEPVTSPTFALIHEYAGARSPVYHLDLYRLRAPDELLGLGWHDVVGAHALVLVEWPERAGALLPADHVPIALAHDPAHDDRRLLLAG
ncbi:MAG TPA: tRNA (adenosine(37)-N6)-threonylcarbamoyltransferase complex ATPase subunit type 1 TsaE [Gemmatimonadaceae bacterium]|nr:tRNA (adenosine(37)-N6)-threonylcarbamoyltransferase complex ATPase subunit type 1 TsaE [Gemmatimonadaceae bacterium]